MQTGRHHSTIGTVFPATVSPLGNQAHRLVRSQRNNHHLRGRERIFIDHLSKSMRLTRLLTELLPLTELAPTFIKNDNQGAIAPIKNPVKHMKAKHIDIVTTSSKSATKPTKSLSNTFLQTRTLPTSSRNRQRETLLKLSDNIYSDTDNMSSWCVEIPAIFTRGASGVRLFS